MKYKRLTKRISDGEEAFLFHSSLHEGIERLAELEDKIERGELISTKEVGDTEIEFFCKHNDTVRKDTAQRALVKVAKAINAIPWSNVDYEKSLGLLGAVEDIAKEYGVELIGNSDKLGGENND